MIRVRVLPLLAVAVALGACSDGLVQPTAPRLPEASLAVVGSGVSTQGDLQAALDAASAASTRSTIRLRPGAVIALTATLTHTGSAPLAIDGGGATIVGPDDADAFASTGGADLTIVDLTVRDAGEHGLYVEVPGSRTGTQTVVLRDVLVQDNGYAGLWVEDQLGGGSPASVSVRILRSEFSGNNTAGVGEELTWNEIVALADKDGVRVNEGGAGDLLFFLQDSYVHHNQADGVELDETGDGDVISQVLNTRFIENGDQLQFPDEAPAGFPDDPADYEKDLEDGFDIDENDAGSVWARFENVVVNGNEDEGIDLDETHDGDIHMVGNDIVANDNFGTGIKLTESEDQEGTDGDIVVNLTNVTANDSRDSRGIRLEEFQDGSVLGRIVGGTFDGNDSDGARIEEYDGGDIDFRFENAAFTNNGGDGLQAGESGTVTLVNPVFGGNDDDDVNEDGSATVVVVGS